MLSTPAAPLFRSGSAAVSLYLFERQPHVLSFDHCC